MTKKTIGPRATEFDKTVGARLRAARLLCGKSQEQLAIEIGDTFQQIQKRESGVNRMSAESLRLTCRALGGTVASIFDEDAPAVDGALNGRREIGLLRRIRAMAPEKQEAVKMFIRTLEGGATP